MPKHHLVTEGGTIASAIYSGQTSPVVCGPTPVATAGPDVCLWSGPGRLATINLHVLQGSGTQINFYDSNIPISGGFIPASGHVPIAVVPSLLIGAALSGQPAPQNPSLGYTDWQTPFRLGLCVNSRSGQPGFTVTFTPEGQ